MCYYVYSVRDEMVLSKDMTRMTGSALSIINCNYVGAIDERRHSQTSDNKAMPLEPWTVTSWLFQHGSLYWVHQPTNHLTLEALIIDAPDDWKSFINDELTQLWKCNTEYGVAFRQHWLGIEYIILMVHQTHSLPGWGVIDWVTRKGERSHREITKCGVAG